MPAWFNSLRNLKGSLFQKKRLSDTDKCRAGSTCMVCYPVFDHVPHLQYLDGNEPASPDEQEDVLAFIRRASRHRDQLIYQLQDMVFAPMIVAMQTHRAILNQEVNRLDSRIRDAQTIVSPVRRLTYDVLQEIFIRCLPDHILDSGNSYDTQPTDLDGSFKAALTLSHVCKRWRSTSLSLPMLWGNLPTYTERRRHHTWTSYRYPLPLYQMMVERSRNSGLNFFLNLSLSFSSVVSFDQDMRGAEDHLDPVASFLIEHSARWNNVILSNLTFKHVSELSNIKGRLTNLTYLEVSNYDYWPPTHLVSIMDLLDGTPKLRTFMASGHFYGTHLPGPGRPTPSFRLQHLTTLEMSLYGSNDLCNLAAFCSETLRSLKIVSLSAIGKPEGFSDADNVYEFPQLTRLDLLCSTGNTFNYLRMPLLERLTWEPIPLYDYKPPLLPLYEMISRSSDSLQHRRQHPLKELRVTADLNSLKPEGPNLIHLFSQVPNLSTLHIPIPSLSVIHALTEDVNDPAPQLLPSLEVCIFTHQVYPHLPDELRTFTLGLAKSLNDFAASRCEWASVSPMYVERNGREGRQSVKRLKSFQILLSGLDHMAGSYLYRSLLRPLVPKMRKTSSSFRYLLKTLAHDVPGAFWNTWDPWNPTDPPVWHGCWNQWRSRVVRTFAQIAALDLDLWTIIESRWYISLQSLRLLMLNDAEFHRHHSFLYEIIRDQHDECRRKFDEQPWTQRWLLSPNSRVLLYIPKDDPIMNTSCTSEIVYDRGAECSALQEAFLPFLRHFDASPTSRYDLLGF